LSEMRLEEEKRQAEQKLKETEEQKLYLTVKVSFYYTKGCSISFPPGSGDHRAKFLST
jgi:hypothetical protein